MQTPSKPMNRCGVTNVVIAWTPQEHHDVDNCRLVDQALEVEWWSLITTTARYIPFALAAENAAMA